MLLHAFRLVANGIGGRTVEELARRMSDDEFLGWIAFGMMEPFGEERADWRAAAQMALLANVNRGKRRPFKVKDFLLRFDSGARREKSMGELEAALYRQYVAWGGRPMAGGRDSEVVRDAGARRGAV